MRAQCIGLLRGKALHIIPSKYLSNSADEGDAMVDFEDRILRHESSQRRFPILVSVGILFTGIVWAVLTTMWSSRFLHLSQPVTEYFTMKSIVGFLMCGIIIYLVLMGQMKKSRLFVNALERHRAKYQETLETIYDGYYEIDLSGNFLRSNTSLQEIFETTQSALVNRNIYEYFETEVGLEVHRLLNTLVETSSPIKGFPWKHVLLDGTVRFLEASASLIRDSRNIPIGYRGIIRNTTGRIRDQEAIVERESQLRSLLDAIPECVVMKDGEGHWLVANDHMLRVFGLTGVDCRGKTGRDVAETSKVYERMLAQCAQSDENAWETGEPVYLEQVLAQSDGGTKRFEIIKLPEFHGDGRRNRLVVLARDITERRRTEELMIKSEKLSIVGQLAAGVAHEIRNPLTSIRGFVQLLESTSNGNRDYFHIILAELLRIESIINEFLLLAKPEAFRTQEADVTALIEQTITLLGPQAVLHDVHIIYTNDRITPLIECEPNQLKQVFINLLKNAIEAMSDGGTLEIRVCLEESSILIQFVDSGCGIPEDRLERLGEPFYTTKEKGTGVGLMVSQRIIETHQGTLTVQSEVGQGTSVEVRLPLRVASANPAL